MTTIYNRTSERRTRKLLRNNMPSAEVDLLAGEQKLTPCDQKKIASPLKKGGQRAAPQSEAEKELENLFQSLLQRAFRGELVG